MATRRTEIKGPRELAIAHQQAKVVNVESYRPQLDQPNVDRLRPAQRLGNDVEKGQHADQRQKSGDQVDDPIDESIESALFLDRRLLLGQRISGETV